jgi:hypothetical protein
LAIFHPLGLDFEGVGGGSLGRFLGEWEAKSGMPFQDY